ncbi:hypothetical protein RM572_25290 [Streptomyces sp. DSM 42041]|uniref:PucR family transcriptional regulator n=1 Tax=Streptomyces hazeniae TaxID=3075538 RepID=A0ABU2NYK4_9ACTN|nr:hypothetical protein [Streptomyces sp. DSM 42041]MDT0382079.1 hypothetical protein [Streptomyces sp. DSM 42041]
MPVLDLPGRPDVLTLRDLTDGGNPLLTYLYPVPARAEEHGRYTVEQAEVCGADGSSPRDLRPGALAVLPPDACRAGARVGDVARVLTRQRAGAVVLAGPGHEPPDPGTVSALGEATSAAGLPLLVPVRPSPAWQVVAAVRAARHHAAAAHALRLAALMRCVDGLYRAGDGPEGLLAHLGESTDAGVYLAAPSSTGWRLLADDGCEEALLKARAHGTGPSGAAVRTAVGDHVLLAAVGDRGPFAVLAGVRGLEAGPWPDHLREVLVLATTQTALLTRRAARTPETAPAPGSLFIPRQPTSAPTG